MDRPEQAVIFVIFAVFATVTNCSRSEETLDQFQQNGPYVSEEQFSTLKDMLQQHQAKFEGIENANTHMYKNNVKRLLVNDPSFMEQRVSHLESLVQQQQKEIANLKSMNSQMNGLAARGAYFEKGAGTDYLCLPLDPTPGAPAGTVYVNHLYGVEFETNFWKSDSHDEDAPCAVCRNPSQTTTTMVPGRNKCYAGWTFQYEGHIGSGYYDHASSHKHVCVDSNPDYLRGGEGRDTDGALFYPVITVCGTLQCPPYKNNLKVPCVGCTR